MCLNMKSFCVHLCTKSRARNTINPWLFFWVPKNWWELSQMHQSADVFILFFLLSVTVSYLHLGVDLQTPNMTSKQTNSIWYLYTVAAKIICLPMKQFIPLMFEVLYRPCSLTILTSYGTHLKAPDKSKIFKAVKGKMVLFWFPDTRPINGSESWVVLPNCKLGVSDNYNKTFSI